MSPRSYKLGQREAAIQQTRERILLSARVLLTDRAGGFTVDSVARYAGVARMTVYYQYGSKRGLLEAVYDDIAARGGLRFQEEEDSGRSDGQEGKPPYVVTSSDLDCAVHGHCPPGDCDPGDLD